MSGVHQVNTDQLSARDMSEANLQESQGTPRSGTTGMWPADLLQFGGGSGNR